MKTESKRKFTGADPAMGPIGFTLASIRTAFSGLLALFKNPKVLFLTIFIALVQTGLAYLKIFLPENEIVKYASIITFAQGGMYAGLIGAIGGVIGKGFYTWFINVVVFSLFKRKNKTEKIKEPKVKGAFGFVLAGIGLALITYNFLTGNASIENSVIGVTALMASFRALKQKNGFMVGFLCSFTKGKMTRNAAGIVIKGMMVGFFFGVLSSLKFSGPWCYIAGVFLLFLALITRLGKRRVVVASGILIYLMGSILPIYATLNQVTDRWVTVQEAYGIKGDTLSSYIELTNAVSAAPPANMEITLIAVGAKYFDESVAIEHQKITIENGESSSFKVEAEFEDFSFNSLVSLHLEPDGYYATSSTAFSANNSWTNEETEEGNYQAEETAYFSFRHLGSASYQYTNYLEPGKFYMEINIPFGYGDLMGQGQVSSATQILARVDLVKRDLVDGESNNSIGYWELKESSMYMLVPDYYGVVNTVPFNGQYIGDQPSDKITVNVSNTEISLASRRTYSDGYSEHIYNSKFGQPPSRMNAFDVLEISFNQTHSYYDSRTNQTSENPNPFGVVGLLPGRRANSFSSKINADDDMTYPFGADLSQTWFELQNGVFRGNVPPGKVAGEMITLELALGFHEAYDSKQSRVWELPVLAYIYEWKGGVIPPSDDEDEEGIGDDYWDELANEEETAAISIASGIAGLVGAAAVAAGLAGGSGHSGYIKKDEDGDYVVRDPVTGEERIYVKNKETGYYTNPLSGAEYTEDELYRQVASRSENADVLRQDYELAKQAKAEQRAANQKLSQAQAEVYKEDKLRNIQRDLEKKGEDGDELAAAMAAKLNRINANKNATGSFDPKDLAQFQKTYQKWTNGSIAGNSGLPPAENEWEIFKQGIANTGEEIARGESNKAIALRIAVSLLTGSFVARGVMSAAAAAIGEAGLELAQAGYVLKDYVDKGGNDWKEGAQQAITKTIVGEAVGRTFGLGLGAIGKAVSKTGQVLSKVKAGKYIVDGVTNLGEKVGKVLTSNVGDVPKVIKSLAKEATQPAIANKMAKAGATKLTNSLELKTGKPVSNSMDDIVKKTDSPNTKSVSSDIKKEGTKAVDQTVNTKGSKVNVDSDKTIQKPNQAIQPKDTPEYKKASSEVDNSLKQAEARANEKIAKYKDSVSKDPELAKRQAAHIEGGKQGKEAVDNLNQAREKLAKNPDSPELKKEYEKAIENVQKNKHAQKIMNEKDLTSNSTREDFNNTKVKKDAVITMNTNERIAKEFGLDPKSVSNVQATNNMNTSGVGDIKGVAGDSILGKRVKADANKFSEKDLNLDSLEKKGGEKISIDLDQTYRVEIKKADGTIEYRDISARKIKQIQNEEVYKEWNNGDLPMKNGEIDHEAVEKFAEDMDYTVLDARSPDAYGTVGDLKQALKNDGSIRDYGDAEGVSRTIQYKSDEWGVKAGHKSSVGNIVGAEGDIAEGIRQGTKQFDSQLVYQVKAINAQGGKIVIPEKLSEGMTVLKQIGHGQGKLSPAEAEAVLKKMGTSTDEILKMNSEQTEIINRMIARRFTK